MFNDAERSILNELADVLIPRSNEFPSASEAGVAGDGLDQVLTSRPDLVERLTTLLTCAKDRNPSEVVDEWRSADSDKFGLLAEVVSGAYFLNAGVCAAIGYHGQVPRPILAASDNLDSELLQPVIKRGAIYRPSETK